MEVCVPRTVTITNRNIDENGEIQTEFWQENLNNLANIQEDIVLDFS